MKANFTLIFVEYIFLGKSAPSPVFTGFSNCLTRILTANSKKIAFLNFPVMPHFTAFDGTLF